MIEGIVHLGGEVTCPRCHAMLQILGKWTGEYTAIRLLICPLCSCRLWSSLTAESPEIVGLPYVFRRYGLNAGGKPINVGN